MKVQSSDFNLGLCFGFALKKGFDSKLRFRVLLSKTLALVAQNLGMGLGF